jgi:predicted AlkP superfamily phosphohydrolase/phosphomutase
MADRKVLIIGLDCATPQFVFDKWSDQLPAITSLMNKGSYGLLKSCVPPITVPAWSCMMSGKSPGTLGCYGFRNRCDYSYEGMSFATSRAIKEDRVWDILSRAGKKVVLVGVPQTYPPTPVNGLMVTCFLTPDTSCQYTHPRELAAEIKACVGDYMLDVDDFRSDNKEQVLAQIYEMTEKRFRLFKHFLQTKPWDFAMMVEMGIDRMHHGFWKYMDQEHPKYEQGSKFQNAILDYYKYIDGKIAGLLTAVDESTVVFIVSDHGARTMTGGFCINEWLMREGYLTIAEKPEKPMPIGKTKIDWQKTMAWGEGGYYSRLFLNVKGREPQGCIDPGDYERVRTELIKKLEATRDENGQLIGTKVFRPQDIYSEINGVPPDMIIYFGDLAWRSIGSIGLGVIHTVENDMGSDDANHAQDGIFIMCDPEQQACAAVKRDGLNITDIAPTVLHLLGLTVPVDMEGKVIL